jgi:Oxidoreductase family, NAD-binding Rossmann fold
MLDVAVTAAEPIKVGVIGLDTSHAPAFIKEMNNPQAAADVAGCRVVVAFPQGSADIQSSVTRIPGYTAEAKALGVEIVDSIEELLKRVDCVLLETNDGRPHLTQALPCLRAKKPTFIDKPVAGSLSDAMAIYAVAKKYDCPVFSSSSLRFGKLTQAARSGSLGKITRCETTSPASLEKTHPDLFWYGIHGVESLFTVMGTGCQSVQRGVASDGKIEVVGKWPENRQGIFREKASYGGQAEGTSGAGEVGKFDGYRPLVVEIVKFFHSHEPPVSAEETLEIYTFMEAADESKRRSGAEVSLQEVREHAAKAAQAKLAELIPQQ